MRSNGQLGTCDNHLVNRERAAGFIVLGGIVLAVAVGLGIRRVPPPDWTLFASFVPPRSPEAPWLEKGSPVEIAGVPVGQVRNLEAQPDGRVRVELEIEGRVKLPRGTRAIYEGPCHGPAVLLVPPTGRSNAESFAAVLGLLEAR